MFGTKNFGDASQIIQGIIERIKRWLLCNLCLKIVDLAFLRKSGDGRLSQSCLQEQRILHSSLYIKA